MHSTSRQERFIFRATLRVVGVTCFWMDTGRCRGNGVCLKPGSWCAAALTPRGWPVLLSPFSESQLHAQPHLLRAHGPKGRRGGHSHNHQPRKGAPDCTDGATRQCQVSSEPKICGVWVWQIDLIRVRGFAFFIPSRCGGCQDCGIRKIKLNM